MDFRIEDLPALSVRQPWAWAIIHGGKPVENRSQFAIDKMGIKGREGKRIAIHAAKGMTRDEYESAENFMSGKFGLVVPKACDLLRGGVIGSAVFGGIINKSMSPWFFGPKALLMSDPQACEFIAATGALGLFKWAPKPGVGPEAPAKWMLAGSDTIPDGALL